MDLQNNVLTNSQTQWNSATRSWPGEIHTQFNSMSFFFFFSMLPSFAGIVPGNTSRYLKNTGKESEFSGCSVCIWGFLITLSSHTADKKPSLTTMLHIKTAPGGQKKKKTPAQHWLWSALFVGTIVMSVTLTYILVFRGTFTLTLTLT